MLQSGDFSWREYGRSFMTTNSDKLPTQLLVFEPTSHSQYQTPSFCIHQEDNDEEKVSIQQISGGLSNESAYDHRMLLDDPLIDKTYMTNHEEHRLYIQKVHDQNHPYPHLHRRGHQFHQKMSSGYNNSSTLVRTCVDCNITKTPLWRSGPLGPKSLCNACGIKHHKAQRAKAAAAAEAHGENRDTLLIADKLKKDKRADGRSSVHYKRKKKILTTSARRRKNLCFELDLNREIGDDDNLEYATETEVLEFSVELGKAKPSKRVFPEDEEQAAILLMALSCGIVHS